jgi:hypothetical protein
MKYFQYYQYLSSNHFLEIIKSKNKNQDEKQTKMDLTFPELAFSRIKYIYYYL